MEITVIILAGGYASRLAEICQNTPKTMLKFNGIPFLKYLIEWLISFKYKVIIVAGHKAETIINEFDNAHWRQRDVKIVVEQLPNGTNNAIIYSIKDVTTNNILVCNGDTILNVDIEKAVKYHMDNKFNLTSIVTRLKNVPNQGAIKVYKNKIVGFYESNQPVIKSTNYDYDASNTGYHIIRTKFIRNHFDKNILSFEREQLPKLLQKYEFQAYDNGTKYFLDFGTKENYYHLMNEEAILNDIYKIHK